MDRRIPRAHSARLGQRTTRNSWRRCDERTALGSPGCDPGVPHHVGLYAVSRALFDGCVHLHRAAAVCARDVGLCAKGLARFAEPQGALNSACEVRKLCFWTSGMSRNEKTFTG